MTFYGQLDSINDDFVLGDAGMVHVFVCFDCVEALARIHVELMRRLSLALLLDPPSQWPADPGNLGR